MKPVKPYNAFHAGFAAGLKDLKLGRWDPRLCEDWPDIRKDELAWNRGYEQAAEYHGTTERG